MNIKLKILLSSAVILILFAGMLYAWTGSNPTLGITPADNSTVSKYTSVLGWCWNATNEVDYYEVYAAKDINKDGVISDTDYAGRVLLQKQEDFNRLGKYNQRLTGRNVLKDYTSGDSVFVWMQAKDINGDLAYPDTAVIGLTKTGDSIVPDSMLNEFSIY